MADRPRVAVHKFSSCDGCQLAFLNLGPDLLQLAELVEIVHFAEAGAHDEFAQVDLAFVEGSISTRKDVARITEIRRCSNFLVTIGACATSGGIQALRNLADAEEWAGSVYAEPRYIDSLATSTGIADHVKVDLALWGCPVSGAQLLAAVRQLLSGVLPRSNRQKVCADCKRAGYVCVLVAGGEPCLGPVTRTGCGAICPRFGRGCYGCYGPAEQANAPAMARRLVGLGLPADAASRRFQNFHSSAPANRLAVTELKGGS